MKILHVSNGDMADKWDELTAEQEGACWRMVRKMASFNGSLPADDRKAANRLHWDVRFYRRTKAWLLAPEQAHLGFYADATGEIRQKRVDDEIAEYSAAREKAVAAGKKGAEKRWGETSTQTSPPKSTQKSSNIDHANSLENNETQIATPSPTPPPNNKITNTQSGTAREGLNNFVLGGVGIIREPSPTAKAAVCQQLSIANAEPLVAVYRRWKGARRAKDPDALFRKAAPRMFARLPAADQQRCKPIMPEITVRSDVRASSALLASLNAGSRYRQ